MKTLFPFLALILSGLLFAGCSATAPGEVNDNISFYEVPLVCGAAPEIGCGSRIKPLFLATERQPTIKESWTNRQGTVIAIVWSDQTNKDQREKMMQDLFETNDIESDLITSSNKRKELEASLRGKGKWYKGMAVDELSIEEAGVIADEATGFAKKEGYINDVQAAEINKEIESYFKQELVKVRTVENLVSDSTQEKWKLAAQQIFASRIGQEKTEQLSAKFDKYREEERAKCEESCCDKK